jgi:hypothetical protein
MSRETGITIYVDYDSIYNPCLLGQMISINVGRVLPQLVSISNSTFLCGPWSREN